MWVALVLTISRKEHLFSKKAEEAILCVAIQLLYNPLTVHCHIFF